jgi:uncharacterized ferritin-like protein (DUF455 family)
MELRHWAQGILESTEIEGKLFSPQSLTDLNPGLPLIIDEPKRPPNMGFSKKSKTEKLPHFQEHKDPDKRAICLHRFAGHELLAVEIMAYVLLAFPEAPPSFRFGLAHTLKEEQGHVRLYQDRMLDFGLNFGDLPLYRHFWNHMKFIRSPQEYVSMMSLTFEMANLDFAPIYGKSFAVAGDLESKALMDQILHDEIAHVRFGFRWLNNMKDKADTPWEAYEKSLPPLLTPKRAKGFYVIEEHRKKCGLSDKWIENIKNA